MTSPGTLTLRLPPSDRATLAVLSVVCATLTLRLPGRATLLAPWALHVALLAGFALLVALMARSEGAGWVPYLRAGATVAVMFGLYTTLGHVAFEAVPWVGDGTLARADTVLFLGHTPALWAERHLTYERLEFFSFVYAFFIPYLYMSIFLGLVGRPTRERDEFVTGFVITYSLSFLGYLFVPARGPIVYHAAQFAGALHGGFFHRTIVASIDAMGGPHGAFPSLHVAASTYLCLFDLRHNALRGMLYLPFVLLIAVSTVFVRYHYVVDLLAGLAIAAAASLWAPRWLDRSRRLE